jgi:putative two-component system response regulator
MPGMEPVVPLSADPLDDEVILVADDNPLNRDLLARRLAAQGYRVETVVDGLAALARLQRAGVSLLLLDIMMPGVDGFEVLRRMRSNESVSHVPVIVITALDELDAAARCIELGAEDYLAKPFNPVLLRARVSACLEKRRLYRQESDYRSVLQQCNSMLEERVRAQIAEISTAQLAAIYAMSRLAESKDPETGAHLERMREYCRLLSQALARTPACADEIDARFIETIYAASPLHDIGKVGVPDHVLLKPGKLDAREWDLMRTHTVIGAETLRAVYQQYGPNDFVRMGIDIAESHHEKWDGSGYPMGLAGDDIPLPARILALGDVYDALTSRRCYKEPFPHAVSRALIVEGRGAHFDPHVVDAFLATEDEFIRIRRHYQDPEDRR